MQSNLRLSRLAYGAFATLLLLSACSQPTDSQLPRVTPEISAPIDSETPQPASGEPVMIEIRDHAFGGEAIEDPERPVVVIAAGTTVTFINRDADSHIIVEGFDGVAAPEPLFEFRFHRPQQGDEFTFDEPGTYMVTCSLHPQMNLEIDVQ